jgi:poly(A) polymerase
MTVKNSAIHIVKKLTRAGYKAYFAGGWVRDYVMDHPSDDIDIATDASPQVILDLFPQTIPVGLAFGVIIVVIEGYQFEVSTFRRDVDYLNGRSPESIELATPEEDATRRDFTINGLFFDPLEEKIYDYVHGLEDIKKGIVKTIGDPFERFYEDRLRMIRAIRFAARFAFPIDLDTQQAIQENANTLFPAVAMERILNEFHKMAKYPRFDLALIEMHRLGLLSVIFPALSLVHLNEIKNFVTPFSAFPSETPTIVYLLQLFPKATSEEIKDLCLYLKTSTQEAKTAEFILKGKTLLASFPEKSDVEKVFFYAHPLSELCIAIFAAHLSADDRVSFYVYHKENKERLISHIQRIINKKPLIDAKFLIEQSIPPGKGMGLLLKEAEEMSIMQNIQSAEALLKILKQSVHWPK